LYADVHYIRELIAAHPTESRRGLSHRLCAAWDWRQSNGAPRDMVCRGLILELSRAGHIELPAVRRRPPNPLIVRARPQPIALDQTPLQGSLQDLPPLTFCHVRRTAQESLFNSLLQA